MKVINNTDGSMVGVFDAESLERELSMAGLTLDDCTIVKSQSEIDRENLLFLESSDWTVTRHRDQTDSGAETTLTTEEYQALLLKRQAARASVVDQQALIKYRGVMK